MSEKVLELAKKEMAEQKAYLEQARRVIPEQYQCHVLELSQNKALLSYDSKLTPELSEMGVFNYKGKTYMPSIRPYMTVAGRIAWAANEGEVQIKTSFEQIADKWVCKAFVTTKRGSTEGTIEVNFGGGGADRTNPLANAETSAIGRALGFQGYGIIGGLGVASYDELAQALEDEPEPPAKPAEDKSAKPEKADKPAKPETDKPAEKADKPSDTGMEEYTLTSVTKPSKSAKGTLFVKATLTNTNGEYINVYAINPPVKGQPADSDDGIVGKVIKLEGQKVMVKLGTESGKTIIKAIA